MDSLPIKPGPPVPIGQGTLDYSLGQPFENLIVGMGIRIVLPNGESGSSWMNRDGQFLRSGSRDAEMAHF
jgi:hypothetical protein